MYRKGLSLKRGVLFFCLTVLLAVGGCGSRSTIRVGLVLELSGPFRDLGIEGRDGALLAVEEINRAGGIRNRPLEIIQADCGYSPRKARMAFRTLRDKGISVILGPMTSTQGMVILPLLENERVVCVGITTSSDKFSRKKDHFYRVTPSTGHMSREMADYLVATGFTGSLALVYDQANADYSESMAAGILAGFAERGLDRPGEYPFDSRETSFVAVMEKITRDRPDAVYFISSARDTAFLAQYGRLFGYQGGYYSSFWAGTGSLPEMGGKGVEGMILPGFYNDQQLPESYRGFQRRFYERYGRTPNYFSVFGYEAVYLVAEACRKGDLPLKRRGKDFPGFTPLEGVIGTLRFDEYGDNLREMRMVRIENGQFIPDRTPRKESP